MLFTVKKAAQIRAWYLEFFQVVTIPCKIVPAQDTDRLSHDLVVNGPDPQLWVSPIGKKLLPGWYRLTYDGQHRAADHLFFPKIYPAYCLEETVSLPIHHPRGFGKKNLATQFQKLTRDRRLGIDRSIASFPPGTVINLRPHLPGAATHLFRYAFDPDGFRFDPFELDYPKTRAPFLGSFQLDDFKLTYYGKLPFLILCAVTVLRNGGSKRRIKRIFMAFRLFRRKGSAALLNWLAHKAYLKLQPPFSPTEWYRYLVRHTSDEQQNEFDSSAVLKEKPSVAVLVIAGDQCPKVLNTTINSALAQSYEIDQLMILVGEGCPVETRNLTQQLAQQHQKIECIDCELPNMDHALGQVTSDITCLAQSGDRLLPQTVASLAEAVIETDADIAYADEVVMHDATDRVHKVVLRTGFCLDHLLSHPALGMMTAIRTTLLQNTGSFTQCQSVEAANELLILSALGDAKKIVYLPQILLEHPKSKASSTLRRLPVSTISGFLQAHGFEHATAKPTATPGLYSIRYNHPLPGKTGIVIPTKNNGAILKVAVESLERSVSSELYDLIVVDHESDDPETLDLLKAIAAKHQVVSYQGSFNFSKINNFAVRHFDEAIDTFLFMNNDIEAIEPGWLENMRDLLGRREVGIVGATLLYPPDASTDTQGNEIVRLIPDNSSAEETSKDEIQDDGLTKYPSGLIQHAGVMLNVGLAEHYQKYERYEDAYASNVLPNPAVPQLVTRSFSAVTAACLLISREVFETLEGFDETLAVGFQDVDLCLRAGNEGYKVLCSAEAVLFHHESASRDTAGAMLNDPHPQDTAIFSQRYRDDIGRDPFYHPYLSRTETEYRPLRAPSLSLNRSTYVFENLAPQPITPA